MIANAASTGGIPALAEVLGNLPPDTAAAIFVVVGLILHVMRKRYRSAAASLHVTDEE